MSVCVSFALFMRRHRLALFGGLSVLMLTACATDPLVAPASRPGESASTARLIGPLTPFRCGRQEIAVRANAEQAELTVGGKRYLLQSQRSASGARYASTAYPGTSFWSKGDQGMLMIDGQAYPECSQLEPTTPIADKSGREPPHDLTVREWVVESIDGRGVIDSSRTTLAFAPDGQVAGRAGCNRYSGVYRLQGSTVGFSGVATTRMMCGPALMEQEARFLKTLGLLTAWRLQPDGSLLLTGMDGSKLLAR
jgi:putative lipoprotein